MGWTKFAGLEFVVNSKLQLICLFLGLIIFKKIYFFKIIIIIIFGLF